MQKHDRLALETARKEAAGDRYKFVSSSPRNVDAEISHTIRWVRQTIKELING